MVCFFYPRKSAFANWPCHQLKIYGYCCVKNVRVSDRSSGWNNRRWNLPLIARWPESTLFLVIPKSMPVFFLVRNTLELVRASNRWMNKSLKSFLLGFFTQGFGFEFCTIPFWRLRVVLWSKWWTCVFHAFPASLPLPSCSPRKNTACFWQLC